MKKLGIIVAIVIMVTGCARWYEKYGIQNKEEFSKIESIPKIMKALEDENPSNRITAMRYLSKFGPDAKVALLKVKELAESDENKNVRNYAGKTLKLLNPTTCTESQQTVIALNDKTVIRAKVEPQYQLYNGYSLNQSAQNVGVLPVKVWVTNNSPSPIELLLEKIKLISPEGEMAKKVYARYASQRIKSPKWSEWAYDIKNRERIKEYYERNMLKKRLIKTNDGAEGLVFFKIDKVPYSFKGWHFNFSIKGISGKPYDIDYDFRDNMVPKDSLIEVGKKTETISEDKIELAILPWRLKGSASGYKHLILNSITQGFNKSDFHIKSSFYRVPGRVFGTDIERIEKDILKENYLRKSIRPDYFYDAKNMEAICDIGDKLDVNAVLICDFSVPVGGSNNEWYLRIFLIDLNTEVIFLAAHKNKMAGYSSFTEIASLSSDVVKDYKNWISTKDAMIGRNYNNN